MIFQRLSEILEQLMHCVLSSCYNISLNLRNFYGDRLYIHFKNIRDPQNLRFFYLQVLYFVKT